MDILSILENNPQTKAIAEAIRKGENPQTVFLRLCKERGVDPDEFLKKMGFRKEKDYGRNPTDIQHGR